MAVNAAVKPNLIKSCPFIAEKTMSGRAVTFYNSYLHYCDEYVIIRLGNEV